MKKAHPRSLWIVLFSLLAAVSVQAIVAPNPQSLLASKNILFIDGSETSGDHYNARIALTAKFTQLRTLVGFRQTTVSGSNPPTNLDAYDIIVFNYWFNNQTSPAAFQNAFRAWVNSTSKKRGWLGMHTSGANQANEWNWFRDSVTAMAYNAHSTSAQAGTIRRSTADSIRNHPIMSGLPDTVRIPSDEWYDFEYPDAWKDARVMYNLDESTLPTQLPTASRMNPHPSAWFRENHLGNRFFYTGLVHSASGVNLTAHNDFFASLMLRGLEYVAGYQPTSIALNGEGLFNGKAWLHVANRSLTITSSEPYQLEIHSLAGKLLFSAKGAGGENYAGVFSKSGFYVVKVVTKTAAYTQRVMAQ